MEKRDMLNQANNNGYTPAIVAARDGHVDVVRLLAEKGANLGQANNEGATPTLIAAQQGHADLANELDAIRDAGGWRPYVAEVRRPYARIRLRVSTAGLVVPGNRLYHFIFGDDAKEDLEGDEVSRKKQRDDQPLTCPDDVFQLIVKLAIM